MGSDHRLTICIHSAAGQTNVPVAQTGARVATKGGAQASNARPNGPTSRNVGHGEVGPSARAAYLRPTQIETLRRPENFPGRRSAPFVPRVEHQGLIHIRAELGTPTAYPAPGSRVTTTLYARRIELPLGSDKVCTRITP